MPIAAKAYILLVVSPSFSATGDVVAVSPCILGPGVRDELGTAVTEIVVTALSEVPNTRVMDRSLTSHVLREQDLILVSRATAILPHRFGDLGAQQVLVIGLLRTPSHFLLSLRLIDVATGELLKSAVHQVRSEARLLAGCGNRVKALWESVRAARTPGDGETAADHVVETLWHELNNARVRELLGPDMDRAGSVYRQYRRAVQANRAEDAKRLSQVAGVYLMDCLSLFQRASHPPVGMVYVSPGWVTVSVGGRESRRFWVDAFFIDRCEYTRGEYSRFLEATGRAEPLTWSEPSEQTANLPVVGVDWYDADAVAGWRGMELPSYPQWLRAVRGEHPQKYPWGETWRAEQCNFARDPRHPVLEPVGSHPGNASCFGVLDGTGSVFEWLDSWYSSVYWTKAPVRNPGGPTRGSAKLAMGGSYRSDPGGCRCSSAQQLAPGTRTDDLGFRCVLRLRAISRNTR